ncbi:PQQ-binding-like beta-propeller repeat protein [Nocardioides baculatus]|uniref:PQQ-binding-like beta-propeller repeat protein n=1 Tax=Nocardioides baculatus TaxID=2801337 RepID=A0ABS1LBW0_9ACTN|nr:PQQ-binding-like beta-propeller repeat protein [Nocardioides baculatus]MBL0749018.1 PQQ-binding-like beta-propeller repeat protein [Nocardioides baculatus]
MSVVACLAATTLAGCTASAEDRERDCRPSGSAVVTGVADDGRTWTAATAATEEPPDIGGGYVLVRHPCGWTAIDLEDGAVVRTGFGEAAGIAGGFVFTLGAEGDSVDGEPVVEGDSPDGYGSMTVTSPGSDMRARAVADRLYVHPGGDGPSTLSQYAGPGDQRWDALLPVLRQPTLTPVGSVLVVTSTDGSVYGLDMAVGTVRWRVLAPSLEGTVRLRARPRGDDEVVLTTWDRAGKGDTATVVVLDAATGEELDRTAAPDPLDPVLAATADGWRVTIDSEPILQLIEQ